LKIKLIFMQKMIMLYVWLLQMVTWM